MRSILVVIHAGSGIAGLLAGLLSISPPQANDNRGWVRAAYLACVAVLLGTLIALIALDWEGLDTGARITFTALAVLAAVMTLRIALAIRLGPSSEQAGRYIDHMYFAYISLWMGFVILPALNLPTPQVWVPLIAAAVLVSGHLLITRFKRRVLAER